MPRVVFAAVMAVSSIACARQVEPQTPPEPAPRQPQPPPDPPDPGAPRIIAPDTPAPAARQGRIEDLPVALRLGIRVETARRAVPVWPEVVIVPDEASYVEAIANWSPRGRFPVLLDDGTPACAEDIGRFVRAYQPERVLRYSATVGAEGVAPAAEPWPEDGGSRRARIDMAIARSWGAAAPSEIARRLQEAGLIPPGLVVADPLDPAWTAGLAIAAARGLPIAWEPVPAGGVNGEMSPAAGEAFAGAVESACERIGLPWRATGDAIEAVAICLNAPVKVRIGPGKTVATTDYVGRLRPDGASNRENGARWAWAGQIFGSPAQSAYRAMCGLFLQPRRAWLFDGYPDSPPWTAYDATRAAEPLRVTGIEPLIDDTPRQGREHWVSRVSRPIDAGLILINSKGNADFFDLEPGRCGPGDAPVLNVPAVVHFVHSWSAAWPTERTTIAARWLERGAYAYAGSVQEPYLQAFVPTPNLAARLASTFPWGAAVRVDDGPAWRIAVIGDPMLTLGPPPPAALHDNPLTTAEVPADRLAPALRERRFADAMRLLTLLGRDADAADLAEALMRDDPRAVTPDVAGAAVMSLFRAGRPGALVEAFGYLGPEGTYDPPLLDALWLAALPRATASADEKALTALRPRLRPGQVGRDAAAIASAFSARFGRDSALGMLRDARGLSTSSVDTEAVDAAVRRLEGR